MITNRVRILFGVGLLAVCILGFGSVSLAQNTSVELLGFKITFEGVDYNPVTNESTWTYRVQGTYTGPHDLSHWILQLCRSSSVKHVVVKQGGTLKTSHPGDTKVSDHGDPHHNIAGIKFDVGVNKNGGDTYFWFVLEGDWEIGEVDIAGKAGQLLESSTILGPSCDPTMCEVHYSVSHGRTDLRASRPGTYASVVSVITLSGNGGVKLEFDEFTEAQYLVDPSAPPVRLEYSIGNTLAEADEYGWFPIDQFNASDLYIDKADVQLGYQVSLWVRWIIQGYNFSSDYESSGRVSITADCP